MNPEVGYCVSHIPDSGLQSGDEKECRRESLIVLSASSRVLIALNQFDFGFFDTDAAAGPS
jgi:hypothetical protein